MKSLPGSNLWSAQFVGNVQISDWDLNNGGVILWDDGTIWSYEAESPAAGDQDKGAYPWYGFCITERKPDSPVWERLTPDSWALPINGQPPGYPNWPTFSNSNDWMNDTLTDFEGPLSVAQIGSAGDAQTDWRHIVIPGNDDEVLFYSYEKLGPILINRRTRTWKRFLNTSAARDTWYARMSNVVHYADALWFFAAISCGEGLSLVRVPMEDLSDYTVLHTWEDPGVGTSSSWLWNHNTSNLDMASFLDNQYIRRLAMMFAIDKGNGDFYVFSPYRDTIVDPRSSTADPFLSFDWNVFPANSPDERNYHKEYSRLQKFNVDDPTYTLELLYWHCMNQEWVGKGATSGYGTVYDGTVGITSFPDGSRDSDLNRQEAINMGFAPSGEHCPEVRDGWLYWHDWSGRYFGVYGDPTMICRVQLSKFAGEPLQHNGEQPIFEIITNGTVPWEGNAGHWGDGQGTYIWYRAGAQPIMPKQDQTMTFDDDGNLWFKGMYFPPYYNENSEYGGYGTRGIWVLRQNQTSTTIATLTFTGDELNGYSPVREVPSRSGEIEVELS